MKRLLSLLILLGLLIPLASSAAAPGFLAFNEKTSNLVEVIGASQKIDASFNLGPKPLSFLSLPDQNGYLAIYRGSTKFLGDGITPGSLVYLDQQYKPTGKRLVLPGIVLNNYYLKDTATLIVITASGDSEFLKGTLSLCNLQSGTLQSINLDSIPGVYRLTPDQKQLAIATIGNAAAKITPKLSLIDLASLQSSSFPVSVNPGAIFFLKDQKLLVACGGFRDNQKYPENTIIDRPVNSVPAKLHFIDPVSGKNEALAAGYSPLSVLQDHQDPDLIYTASNKAAVSDTPAGIFMKVSAAQVLSKLDFPGEPVELVQAKQGNLCIRAYEAFFLISPQEPKLITKINYELRTDSLILNEANTSGILTVVNSKYFDLIDLRSGQYSKLEFGSSKLLGEVNLSNLFRTPYPAVTGFEPFPQTQSKNISPTYRMFLGTDPNQLFIVSNSSLNLVDLSTKGIIAKIKFDGTYYGIHPTPNHKFVVVSTDTKWYLMDPQCKTRVLEVNLSKKDEPAPRSGFYSPDGNLLVIPTRNSLHLIDTQSGKYLGKIQTKIDYATILWPQ